MKRILFVILMILCGNAYAGTVFNPFSGKLDKCITVQEEDGSPSVTCPETLKFPNGNVTDNGDGTFSIADNTSIGGGNSLYASEDTAAVYNNASSDMTLNVDVGLDFSGSGQVRTLGLDPSEKLADATNSGFISSNSIASIDSVVLASHDAVTITGEDFLSLSGQQITANAVNPDNLASADFGDFTCNGTTCTLDGGASGGNSVILTVCSSTTSYSCDYTADGTADEVEINTALGAGNYVMLSDGVFTIADRINVPSDVTFHIPAGATIKPVNSYNGTTTSVNSKAVNAFVTNSDHTNGNDNIKILLEGEVTAESVTGLPDTESWAGIWFHKTTNSVITGGGHVHHILETITADGGSGGNQRFFAYLITEGGYNLIDGVEGSYTGDDTFGIRRSSDYNIITNCVSHHNKFGHNYQVAKGSIFGNDGTDAVGNKILNNVGYTPSTQTDRESCVANHSATHTQIHGNTCFDNGAGILVLGDSQYVSVRDNIIIDPVTNGIWHWADSSAGVSLRGNSFVGNTIIMEAGTDYGILVDADNFGITHATFENNTIIGTSADTQIGMKFDADNTNSADINDITISGGTIRQVGLAGIELEPTTGEDTHRFNISDMVITESGYGILLDSASGGAIYDITIDNVEIYTARVVGATATAGKGILIDDATDVTVANSRIEVSGVAIEETSPSDRNFYINNNLKDSGTDTVTLSGANSKVSELYGDIVYIPTVTVATLPSGGYLAIVSDGANDADCTTGSGSTYVMCMYNGTTWEPTGDSGSGGGGDSVLVNTTAIVDGSGVDLTSGTSVSVTLNSGASPDTATFDVVDDSIGATELADADFGDFTCSDGGGGCLLDADTVGTSEISTNGVGADELDGSMSESISGNWDFFNGNLGFPKNTATTAGDCDADAEAGRIFYDTDQTTKKRLYVCEGATNGWVQYDASGGGGGSGATNYTLPIYSAKLTGAFVTHTPAGCSTTASTQGAQIDAGQGNWRLLFDATTDEASVWQFVIPDNYSSTPVLDVHFSMASGEANEVEYEAAIMCYTPTTDTADIGTASFANCAVGTATTVSATAGEVYSQSITLTDDSCAAGDTAFIWLSTDADDATNDDATGDREVVNVEFSYS